MHRLIGSDHRDSPLGAVASPSRFSDPAGKFSVLYAAETVSCAFWEALARNRFTRRRRRELPLADVAARVLVSLCSDDALNLVDLRTDGPVRIGAPTAVAHDANHAAGRALAAVTYASVPQADGFLYLSRFTGDACVAVFDRAFGRLSLLSIMPLVASAEFLQALDDYDVVLTKM